MTKPTFFVMQKGRKLGPFTLEQGRQFVQKGHITKEHKISVGGGEWRSAANFPL
jgi:hypothetical protein